MKRPQLILAAGKEKALLRRHPWIFSGAVKRIIGEPQEGDLVDIQAADGHWLAVGHYQNESIICKVLSFDTQSVDERFFEQRLKSAIGYRKRLGFFNEGNNTNVFRLVNGEGDFLPGLICDWYNGVLVMQAHSVGMHRLFSMFTELFVNLLSPYIVSVFDKSSATVPGGSSDGFLWGDEAPEREICEHGNRMFINFFEGQKTGFFVDQRENRRLVGELAKGHRVLNCFGYTGGFSLAALRGGAEYVETVDISKKAIELCNRNVELNFGKDAPHKGTVADVLQFLNGGVEAESGKRKAESGEIDRVSPLSASNSQFDIIILDPPAFAKNHRSLQQGLKGYRNINQKAMEKIADGGLLFTFSCSQAVSRDDFQTMVFTAAANAHKKVRIVRQLPHALDHPISIYHPEGEYLKGLLLQIEKA
ncbi:MAG: class I SAM-dependent rRNA methyltransferase [Bacteroidales bacterium]|nr:class I SAM-dependent rRNA methyltransferase [Bacteroidales bacterium]